MKPCPLFLSLVSFALLSCNHATQPLERSAVPLDASVNGTIVACQPDQPITLDLDVSADAGYQWDCSVDNGSVLVTNGDPTFRQKNPGPVVPGGAVIETLYFRAASSGQCNVTLIEHQRWMKDVPPIKTVAFTVIVR